MYVNLQDTSHLLFYQSLQYNLFIKAMNFEGNSSEQLKIMAQVLCKMSKFFNQMTELCLLQLTDDQSIKYKHRTILNKQTIRNFQNSKKLEKLKLSQNHKKQQKISKIKSLKPKHPVSSFFFFYSQKGQQIAKQRGEVLGSKIAKIVGELWKNMSEAERQPYQTKARQTRQKYEEQMIHYKQKYGTEIAQLKKQKRLSKEVRPKKRDEQKQTIKIQTVPYQKELYQKDVVNEDLQQSLSEDQSLLAVSDDMSDSLQEQSDSLPLIQRQIKQMNQLTEVAQQNELKLQDFVEESQFDALLQIPSSGQKIQALLRTSQQNQIKGKHLIPKFQSIITQLKNNPQEKEQIIIKNEAIEVQQKVNENQQQLPKQQVTRPKGPVSSFFLFYKSQGKRISQQYHLPLGPKTIKLASQLWRKMDPSQKQKYLEQSQKTRSKYHNQVKQLKEKYGNDVLFERRRGKNSAKERKKGKKILPQSN